jgi:hypothetical protein
MSRLDVGVFARPDWPDALIYERFKYLMDYLFWTGNEVVSYARSKNLNVHDLKRDDAIHEKVEDELKGADPVFFFHASHGGDNILTGQGMSNLICCPGAFPCPKPNHEVLSDRVTYTLSCSSAKELGPAAIEVNGISYIGYLPYLWICVLEGDDLDAVFKDIWAGGAIALIDGKTTGEAYNWLKRRYECWISYWEMNPGWEAPIMLWVLKADLQNLKLLGKRDARIRSTQTQVESMIKEEVRN